MHKRQQKQTAQGTTTPDITWFTPSVGATSTNCVLFNLLQNPSLICALSCRSLRSLTAAHTAAGLCAHSYRSLFLFLQNPLRTQLQRSSTHTAGTLSFPYKNQPYFALVFLYIKRPNLSSLHRRLFILRIFTKPWS